ncbi:MAG: glycosyltransferase family 9 protein [bacterium]
MDNQINRILVIRLSSLGDIILTTPVIRSLKKRYPAAAIDFLIRVEYSDVVKHNPNINSLHVFQRNSIEKEFREIIRQKNYDLILDLQNNLRSRRVTAGFKGDIYRFKKPSFKKFLLVNFKINKLIPPVSITQRYADSFPGLQLDDAGAEIFYHKQDQLELSGNENYIGICPGSRHFTKKWPEEYFIKLCRKLISENYKPLLFGGADDVEQCKRIVNEVSGAANFSNNDEILQTVSDMKKCKVVICNDSGMMHAAAAVSVPVIAIFGSTVKEFGFTPYKVTNLILENNLVSCRPCSHTGKEDCPQKHFRCMQDITPAQVFDQFKGFINTL